MANRGMNILCIADSLGLPRDGVKIEDTWFYKLCHSFPQHHFIDRFERGMLTSRLIESEDFSNWANPDIAIIQLGICDCAPRVINDNRFTWTLVLRVIKRLRIEKTFWTTLKKIKGRNNAKCVYTPIKQFENNVKQYICKLHSTNIKKIIIIKIALSDSFPKEKSPYFKENVQLYNNIYQSIQDSKIKLIDPLGNNGKDNSNYFLEDHYHLNAMGMDKVFQTIKEILEKNNENI